MIKALHITVEGRVQGVFYRKSTQDKARALNLSGWVKNKTNGNVEIWAEGEENELGKLLEWAAEGPPQARVTNIDKKEVEPAGYGSFDISH